MFGSISVESQYAYYRVNHKALNFNAEPCIGTPYCPKMESKRMYFQHHENKLANLYPELSVL